VGLGRGAGRLLCGSGSTPGPRAGSLEPRTNSTLAVEEPGEGVIAVAEPTVEVAGLGLVQPVDECAKFGGALRLQCGLVGE
jgi:hypothetical protein